MKSFEKNAQQALMDIQERAGSAFKVKATKTRVGGTTSSQLSGSIHPTN